MIKLFSLKMFDNQSRRKDRLIFCSNSYCKLNYADFIRRQSLLLNEFTSRLFDRCLNRNLGLIANPTNAHTNYLIKLLKSGRLSDLL